MYSTKGVNHESRAASGLLPGEQAMSNKPHEIFRGIKWIVVGAMTLISISILLNVVVAQTLASLSVASVILALYVAVLAYVVGGIALIVISMRVLLPSRIAIGRERMYGWRNT
jgi:hypothetical protein